MTDELRRLAEAATPGPWMPPQIPEGLAEGMVYGADGWMICEVMFATEERREKTADWRNPFVRPVDQHQADAAYIAAASPDVILRLLADRDRLIRVVETVRESGALDSDDLLWLDRECRAALDRLASEENPDER